MTYEYESNTDKNAGFPPYVSFFFFVFCLFVCFFLCGASFEM